MPTDAEYDAGLQNLAAEWEAEKSRKTRKQLKNRKKWLTRYGLTIEKFDTMITALFR